MRSFKDEAAREWTVELNVAQARKVRDAGLGNIFEIGNADKPAEIFLIADDLLRLSEVLWVLCEKQATEKGITQDSFQSELRGDAIGRAQAAFLEEAIDCFPKDTRRVLREVFDRAEDMRLEATAFALERLAELNKEKDAETKEGDATKE